MVFSRTFWRHVLLLCLVGGGLLHCRQPSSSSALRADASGHSAFFAQFPRGQVPRREPLRFVFLSPVDSSARREMVLGDLLRFEPEIRGEAVWEDGKTVLFRPAQPLPFGQAYKGFFDFSKLADQFPGDEPPLGFHFKTALRAFAVQFDALQAADSSDLQWQRLEGHISSVDYEVGESVKSLLQASQDGLPLEIRWNHQANGTFHPFSILGIQRKDEASELKVRWNGAALGADFAGQQVFRVPAIHTFSFVGASLEEKPQPHVAFRFTDPLDPDQDLQGMVYISNGPDLKLDVDGSVIRAFPASRLAGKVTFSLAAGVRNVLGHGIESPHQVALEIEEPKPGLRLVGNGNILPLSKPLRFAFETVNLSAVDVHISKIKQINVHQYLQYNSMDGGAGMHWVGEDVARQVIALDPENKLDLKTWNRHELDLSQLFESEAGAMYRVTMAMREEHSLYPCLASESDEGDQGGFPPLPPEAEPQSSFWSDFKYYPWRQRDNPCSPAYFHRDRTVARTFLASNLGLIAKQEPGRDLVVSVVDLLKAEPLQGVEVTLYGLQRQVLGSGRSDARGGLRLKLGATDPFLLVASKGAQMGYLPLKSGENLSMSRFEVGGTEIQNGLQGYIYGERGVWRPGDPIFLTFILMDPSKSLPADHPVVFEMYDPRGKMTERVIRNDGLDGFYHFETGTVEDAPTGDYRVRVLVGGTQFERMVKVETVMPNRLAIQLDPGPEVWLASDKEVQARISSTWLHGAPAADLKISMLMQLYDTRTQFKSYPGFFFDDPTRRYWGSPEKVLDRVLSAAGELDFNVKLPQVEGAPGMLKASLTTKVFEKTGAFSVDHFSVPFSPYGHYVGVKAPDNAMGDGLVTDAVHPVDVVVVDQMGRPTANRMVSLAVYKLDWRWWWEGQSGSRAVVQASQLTAPLKEYRVVTNARGQASFDFSVDYPEWGRFLVRACDSGGHCGGQMVYVDWPGWAGRPPMAGDSAAQLLLSTDKQGYELGEEVVLSIPTGSTGKALVSLETGDRVLQQAWVDAQEGETQFRFKATAEMVPNVYAFVTLLQPHAQTANDLPIRMYGAVPIDVRDPKTRLNPRIQMADVLEPESEFQVTVSAQNGGAMTYTLAVVDEGLLSLTRFKTPDPWGRFFSRQALGVRTWDLYGAVLGALGQTMGTLLTIGGSGSGREDEPPETNRFKPVVIFKGPFRLSAGESRTHNLELPNYVGAVRTMVVAGNGQAFGSAEKSTPVRKPLMLLGTMPRVLGPGEAVDFPLTVFAMEPHVRDVNLTIEMGDLVKSIGPTTQKLRFDGVGEKTVRFPLEVAEAVGHINLVATATSGGLRTTYQVVVPVRNPNPYVTDVGTAQVGSDDIWETELRAVGMPGTNRGVVELSSVPPLNLATRLDQLMRYPYGCLEQSTSALLPQLFLSDLLDLPDAKAVGVSERLRKGVQRIGRFQRVDGSMTFWPGLEHADPWATSYAGHFMLEAKAKGYRLPPRFLERWLQFQSLQANGFHASDKSYAQLNQAYRLYLLAAAGKAQLGAMNRLREGQLSNVAARWLLAGSYALAGQQEAARQVVGSLTTQVSDYAGLDLTYGSSLRDSALILLALLDLGMDERAAEVAQRLSVSLNLQEWLSTHSTGMSLLALSKYATTVADQMDVSINPGGSGWQQISSEKPLAQIELDMASQVGEPTAIRNQSGFPVFVKTVMQGQPSAGQERAGARVLELQTRFSDLEGKDLDITKLRPGQDFVLAVAVRNSRGQLPLRDLALRATFPSGWEIANQRMSNADVFQDSAFTYQDIRDDRVHTFFDLKGGERRVYHFLLNATYSGRFYLPALVAEAMYDGDVYARLQGTWVEVGDE